MSDRGLVPMGIMRQGHRPEIWAVLPQVYSAMVVVSAVACILSPLLLRRLLNRWPRGRGQ